MYNISHTATSYPLPRSPLAAPHTPTPLQQGEGKKVQKHSPSLKSRHAMGRGAVVFKVIVFVVDDDVCRIGPFPPHPTPAKKILISKSLVNQTDKMEPPAPVEGWDEEG